MKFPQVTPMPLGAIHALGLGLKLSQMFENDVVKVFASYEKLSGKMPSEEKLEDEWGKRAKFTLGRIMKKYSKRWPKVDGFLETFQKAIDARNWIIHKSFNENARLLYSRQGQLEFNRIFLKRYTELYEGWELVLAIEDAVCNRIGYTKEQRLAHFLADTAKFKKYTDVN
ncbi:MAG: hypothetical protein ABSC01_01945 [Verrucomicrobiota bacterium]|jgi:hypothetical protein